MLKIGMIIDNRYKILREIGRGGTSCVYLAENIRLHNYWAIKEVYKQGVTGGEVQTNMLIAESSILTKLRHPGLPSIIDILHTPQSYLIVMEYIEGISLDKLLQKGPCSQSDVIKWGCQLCDVLTYLHNQNPSIIYRDMKPANIMLRPDGNIVLIDFGMAREYKNKSIHDTTHLGTHGYAAPEQYNVTKQTDARTDIYSLGVTLYHLVTGHDPCLPPYGLNSICSINPTLSPRLDQVIKKCTQLEPELRCQTANELRNILNLIDGNEIVNIEFNTPQKKKSTAWLWALAIVPLMIVAIVAAAISSAQTTKHLNLIGDIIDIIVQETANEGLYFEQEVYISQADERKFYTFTPEKSGYYDIYSFSYDANPVLWLSDEYDNLIEKDNTKGENADFALRCWLNSGVVYEIETTIYDLDPNAPATGTYWIYVEYVE